MSKLSIGRKILIAAVATLVALLVVGMLFLNWQFEEPGAEQVDSIAEYVGASSVLGVFAHPDDEQLVTGLLIRAAARPDTRTAAVTATKGEAGTPLPQISRPSDLGWVRKAEALKNTWALGVDHHQVLDFPDGGLIDTPLLELVAAVRQQLIQHKPDLVVTFWPESGFSDHNDHKIMGLATEIAILELQKAAQQGYAGPAYIAYMLAPSRMMSRFAGDTGKRVVANQPPANYQQDGEAWAKIRGWKIHASQEDYVWHAYGMPAWLVHRLYDKEHYYLIETGDIPQR